MNVLNLLSESTYIEKMDMQNILLKALVTQSNSNVPVEISSWSMVQQLVRMGVASKVFSVGDQLVCNHQEYGKLVWDVIGIDHDTPADENYKHCLTIQLHNCLAPTLQFDAPEPLNPVSDIQGYGSNLWEESAIRQWLNSDSAAGNWWQAMTEYDAKPNYADTTAGFLRGLDAEFRSAVGPVTKLTLSTGGVIETTEDYFLPSISEVYGGLNNYQSEGAPYEYYSLNSALEQPGKDLDTIRVKLRNGSAINWWTRSLYHIYRHCGYHVNKSGAVTTTTSSGSHGIAPACCIV